MYVADRYPKIIGGKFKNGGIVILITQVGYLFSGSLVRLEAFVNIRLESDGKALKRR